MVVEGLHTSSVAVCALLPRRPSVPRTCDAPQWALAIAPRAEQAQVLTGPVTPDSPQS